MQLSDLTTVNSLSSQLRTLKELAMDATDAHVIQMLCAERQGEGKAVAFIRDADFSVAFKEFVESQAVETIQKLNKLGVVVTD